jgi:rhodanese-related sulfurtransferase
VARESTAAAVEIDPARVAEELDRAEQPPQLVDVREAYEHEAGHIAGDRHIELLALAQQVGALDQARPVLIYCRTGARSLMAAQALRGAGYDAYSMAGGLVRWVAEGKPLEPADGLVADH